MLCVAFQSASAEGVVPVPDLAVSSLRAEKGRKGIT